MLEITEIVRIPDDELEWSFVRASGPGGQNVNKVASKAVLRWRAGATTAAIPERAMARMRAKSPSRFTASGDVLIQSQQFRDQERNREDCLGKLAAMIRAALPEPLPRKATRPTKGSQRRRVADKRRQSAKKHDRRSTGQDD
jgi:ribosome-associated protein